MGLSLSLSLSLSINNNKLLQKKFIHRYGVLHYWVNIKQKSKRKNIYVQNNNIYLSLSQKFSSLLRKKESINFYYQSTEKSIYTNHTHKTSSWLQKFTKMTQTPWKRNVLTIFFSFPKIFATRKLPISYFFSLCTTLTIHLVLMVVSTGIF